jgi:hypothetical protein
MNKIISFASVIALVFAAALFAAPAQAQEQQDANVQQGDAPPQGADPGDAAQPDPFNPRVNARMRAAAPRPPVPEDAPRTEKNGDDLIVHAPGGDVNYPDFLKGLPPGQVRPVTLILPPRGNCTLQVDGSGATLAMTCDQ